MGKIINFDSEFDEIAKYYINKFQLKGRVLQHFRAEYYETWIAFDFNKRYLKVLDIKKYERHLDPYIILKETYEYLKDLEYQFRFYFEGIWG